MGIQEIDLRRSDFEAMHPVAKLFNFDHEKLTYFGDAYDDAKRLNDLWSTWCACVGLLYLETNTAKAQAVPENKIEFDGEYIKYPNSYAIHCQFDEDFDCHIFDVYQNEDCVKDGMTQLKQAHLFVYSMSEAQEPAND